MTIEEKKKIANTTKDKINKDFGDHAVMSLSEKPQENIPVVPTGSIKLNLALGVGGLPRGRVVEIYGPESSGKTTLAIHVIAEAQKLGGLCAIIDAEHAFDTQYAQNLGVNLDNLDINQPDYGEQGLEIADRLISSGVYDVVVIDSVAALVPKAEIEGEMGENKMGLHARLMSQALRKLTGIVQKTGTCLIFINQLREKIGVMYGSPEVTTGGNALKFYASVRIDVRRSLTAENAAKNESGDVVGNMTTFKIKKNKVAPPFKSAEIDIIWGKGFDKIGEIIEMGKEFGILTKRKDKGGDTPMITYGELKVPIHEFAQMIEDNPEFKFEIENNIKSKLNG